MPLIYSGASSESEWSRAWIADLRANVGAQCFVCAANRYGTPGWPDRYICSRVFTGWVEVKREGNVLSTAQKLVIEQGNERAPGTFWVLYLTQNKPFSPLRIMWPTRASASGSAQCREWLQADVSDVQIVKGLLFTLGHYQRMERTK